MYRLLTVFALIGGLALTSCNGNIPVPRETITFAYKYAEQRQPDRYHVQVLRGATTPTDCANQVEDIMRLEQIAFTVQLLARPSVINACHERFSVDVVDARAIDDDFAKFEFYALAGTTDRRGQLIANLDLAGDSYPQPARIQIEINNAIIEGVKTTDGFAEIHFGLAGPTYRCEGSPGEDFWHEHLVDPETDTFFEFTLTSYNPTTRGLGAQFQCLARNKFDSSDNRLLLVMLGSAFMTADN